MIAEATPQPFGPVTTSALWARFPRLAQTAVEGVWQTQCPVDREHGIFEVREDEGGWRIGLCLDGCLPREIWQHAARDSRPTAPDGGHPARLVAHEITLEEARSPPVEHFLVGALFPFGKVSVLFGPSGAGKSALLSQLAFKVAAGGEPTFFGMLMHDETGGPVLVYSAEDTLDDWKRKAGAALSAFGEQLDMRRALARLRVIENTDGYARLTELVQVREDLGTESYTRTRTRPSAERLGIIEHTRKLRPRLVILETASRLVEKESNEEFAALLAAGGHIAAESGAAVIVSHHPTKEAAKENDSDPANARGGYALTANARTVVTLFPAGSAEISKLEGGGVHVAAEDVLVLEHQKGTSSVRKQGPIVLVRCSTPSGGVLRLPHEATADPAQAAAHAARRETELRRRATQLVALYDLVEQLRKGGPVSKRKLRDHGPSLGIPKREVEDFVDAAIAGGVITAEKRDKAGRVLDLGLGVRPGGERATSRDPRIPDDD